MGDADLTRMLRLQKRGGETETQYEVWSANRSRTRFWRTAYGPLLLPPTTQCAVQLNQRLQFVPPGLHEH